MSSPDEPKGAVARRRAVTLHDVADEAGVAVSTASRALANPGRVSPATREHVQSVARGLGYRSTRAATALEAGRTPMLAVLVADITNPHNFGLIRGAETCDDGAANGTLPSCCSAACQIKESGAPCDDGNACTTADTCNGTTDTCVGGAPPNCDDGNSCTADSCNPATGCVNDGPARNGFACNDNNACTQTDTCQSGSCEC